MSSDPPALARRLRGFGTSIFTEMTVLANRHGAINLSQGFPDFPGPDFLLDAACHEIRTGPNQYAPSRGDPKLTEAIAASTEERQGIACDPARQVIVTNGATEALHLVFLAFVEPGDEVVMLEPTYDAYLGDCSVAGGSPRTVTLHAPDFRWREEELRAAFSDRTRLVLLNTPHNPTGRVFDREEMERIAELCIEHDAICVTDEVYDRLVYEGRHISMASLPGMAERTVTINSTGKSFSLTGWKIGWATGPAELIDCLARAHQFVTFSVARPLQRAMASALTAPQDYFERFLGEYRERRDLLVNVLTDCGLGVRAPEGTYFVLADIRPLGWDDDVAFCRHLTEEIGVAAIPPTAFYQRKEHGRFLTRFAFCKRKETLLAAAERLAKLEPRK